MRILKWVGIAFGVVFLLIGIAVVVLYFRGDARINRTFDVQVATLTVPSDSTAVARGRHLAEAVALCSGCHGDDLGGDVLIDEPAIATIYASNLTAGDGGVGATYTDADYVRAIRHGVNSQGRGLMIMHSDAYNNLSEHDVASLIAYIRSVSPVNREVPATKGGTVGKVLVALGMFDQPTMPLIPAEVIDHSRPFPSAPAPSMTPEYGRYLATAGLCAMCHGADFTGGPPMEEGMPAAPNIAIYGDSSKVTLDKFIATMRTGQTPFGRSLNKEAMPWEYYGKMTDEELAAIWLYLTTVER